MRQLLNDVDPEFNEDLFATTWRAVDIDHSGTVTYEEFRNWVGVLSEGQFRGMLKAKGIEERQVID